MIPHESEASYKNGNWFIYNDGNNVIQIWNSYWNGKEKVFINNKLVSEHRSTKMLNVHQFRDHNGDNYEVIFETKSMVRISLICTLKRNDSVLRTFKTEYLRNNNFEIKRLIPIIIASAIFGVLKRLYDLSNLTFALFVVAMLVFYFSTKDNGKIIITEE